MANFPTLSVQPLLTDFAEEPEDSTIRSDFEGGYLQTRPRFTRDRKTFGPVAYLNLTDGDKASLESFYDTVKCASIFAWIHPRTGATKNGRFKVPLKFIISDIPNRWKLSFDLVEA